jgi:hypothetical protein
MTPQNLGLGARDLQLVDNIGFILGVGVPNGVPSNFGVLWHVDLYAGGGGSQIGCFLGPSSGPNPLQLHWARFAVHVGGVNASGARF